MTNSTCSSLSVDTLYYLGIPSTSSESYYSCSTAANYTGFASCCSPSTVHSFPDNPCYVWCDLPASLNTQFDDCTSYDCDAYSYIEQCLQDNGTDAKVLYCSSQPHVITSTATATDTASYPTDTSYLYDTCESAWPPTKTQLATYFDPDPGCAVLPNASNFQAFSSCCEPAEVEYDTSECWEYCLLPKGDGSSGQGNLTVDETLGSFKACLMKQAPGLDNTSLFGGMYCRANKSAVNLSVSDFGALDYLPNQATRSQGKSLAMAVSVVLLSVGFVGFM